MGASLPSSCRSRSGAPEDRRGPLVRRASSCFVRARSRDTVRAIALDPHPFAVSRMECSATDTRQRPMGSPVRRPFDGARDRQQSACLDECLLRFRQIDIANRSHSLVIEDAWRRGRTSYSACARCCGTHWARRRATAGQQSNGCPSLADHRRRVVASTTRLRCPMRSTSTPLGRRSRSRGTRSVRMKWTPTSSARVFEFATNGLQFPASLLRGRPSSRSEARQQHLSIAGNRRVRAK